jgi:hypothetical protein
MTTAGTLSSAPVHVIDELDFWVGVIYQHGIRVKEFTQTAVLPDSGTDDDS